LYTLGAVPAQLDGELREAVANFEEAISVGETAGVAPKLLAQALVNLAGVKVCAGRRV
jgi:hypothetical protein